MSTAADATPSEPSRGRRARDDQAPPAPEPGEDATSEEIEADIVRTRRELGDTVGALSDKLNPKAQATQQVDHLKERAGHQVEHLRGQAGQQVENLREHAGHLKEQAGHQVERVREAAQSTVARVRGNSSEGSAPAGADEGDRAAIAEGMARAHGADEAPSTHGAVGVPGAPAGTVVPDPDVAALRTEQDAMVTDPDAVVLADGTRPGGSPWIAMGAGAAVFAGIGALLTALRR